MITNKMVARRVSAFGLALTGLMTLANAPVKATETSVSDHLYALASGSGWAFAVAHNYDVDNDGSPDNRFLFIHGRQYSIRGSVLAEQITYNKSSHSATFFAAGMNGRTPVVARIEIQATGGRYACGSAMVSLYNDLNRNNIIDAGEPALLARPMEVPFNGLSSSLK